MKVCDKCGLPRKVLITCPKCNKEVCLQEYNFIMNVCVDCDIIIYTEKYHDKIEEYA